MNIKPNGWHENPRKRELPAVLAVDDFNMNLLKIKSAMSGVVHLYMAKSAKDAYKTLATVKIDLILLDLEMPDIDGLEFLEQIRALPSYKDMPVIIVTSNAKGTSIHKMLEYGIIDYIIKPFESDFLRDRVMKVFTNRVVETDS